MYDIESETQSNKPHFYNINRILDWRGTRYVVFLFLPENNGCGTH